MAGAYLEAPLGRDYSFTSNVAATFTALTPFGTGNFAVSVKVSYASLVANGRAMGSDANGFGFLINSSGNPLTTKQAVADNTASTGTVAALQTVVIGYSRTGTTGTYYIDGVAAGTTADSRDYSVGVSALGSNFNAANGNMAGNISWAHVYSSALSAAEMLADSQGTVQANCVFNEDFSLSAKLATSVTATTGQTVTINSTGATGARICGARDLYQGTAANQPILTIAATGNYLTFDGSNDYIKAAAFGLSQPVSGYIVMSQVSWTLNDVLLDGGSPTVQVTQNPTTPSLLIPGGASDTTIAGFPVATQGILTWGWNAASSFLRYNRTAADMGTGPSTAPNGITIGSAGGGTGPANITVSAVLVFSQAHDTATQNRVVQMLGRIYGIAV